MITNLYSVEERRIFNDQVEKVTGQVQTEKIKLDPMRLLSAIAIPNVGKAIRGVVRAQCSNDQALIVCGLERYKFRKGGYPEKLSDMMPEFCETIPLDLITGQPPIYRRKPDGSFELYSVGWDGKDDGGIAAEELDLVWPFHQPERASEQN